jgi:hypothetical protein
MHVLLFITTASEPGARAFSTETIVRIGRGPDNDVVVGDTQVDGEWTVSSNHVEVRFDGERWTTRNVSSRSGLLQVYEPGWEPTTLEPGRSWSPMRHRWSYGLGRPGQVFYVVCRTSEAAQDRLATDVTDTPDMTGNPAAARKEVDPMTGESTALLPAVSLPVFTELEQQVLYAYYADFARLPRPPILEPASHTEAARRLGRTSDSGRKAIERINEKIARARDAPRAATGRHVSGEIGRWLARVGALDGLED